MDSHFPARSEIRHNQVQGAGASTCHWVGAGGTGWPSLRTVLGCEAWGKVRARPHTVPGFKQPTGLHGTRWHLATSLLTWGSGSRFCFLPVASGPWGI